MVSKSITSLLLAASITTAAPALAAAPIASESHPSMESAANSRISYVNSNENRYATLPLEKFTFNKEAWTSRPFTEEELLNIKCTGELKLEGTIVQYCVENTGAGKRPNLITKVVSGKSHDAHRKGTIYNEPIMVMLYDNNSDGIQEGDIIKARLRDGTPVNYTLGFNESIYETWDALACGEFKTVKSGKAGWLFRKMFGWKRSGLNEKYERLLHSDGHPGEAQDFAEDIADTVRDKIKSYLSDPYKCK